MLSFTWQTVFTFDRICFLTYRLFISTFNKRSPDSFMHPKQAEFITSSPSIQSFFATERTIFLS